MRILMISPFVVLYALNDQDLSVKHMMTKAFSRACSYWFGWISFPFGSYAGMGCT